MLSPIINSLYGDAADSPAAAEEPSRDAGEVSPEISETEITTTVVTELTQERIVFAGVPEDIPSVASVLSSQSVKSLRNSVGINDKFLLMRDLFSNDMETYDKSMEKLDGFEDIDDAFIYLQENFTMDPDNEGVKLIVSLLERKHA